MAIGIVPGSVLGVRSETEKRVVYYAKFARLGRAVEKW